MKKSDILIVQKALADQGYAPGPIDGIMGRRTLAAIRAFQADHGLDIDGVVGPLTWAALIKTPAGELAITPPWITLALQKRGFTEHQRRTAEFLKSDGHYLGDPAKFPWCGDFIETCIALTLPFEDLPANPYWAKNWAKFGKPINTISYGAIGVFDRDGGGHVAFLIGQDSTHFHCLGGNQGNAVTIVRIAKHRRVFEGIRWPLTANLQPSPSMLNTTIDATISMNEA